MEKKKIYVHLCGDLESFVAEKPADARLEVFNDSRGDLALLMRYAALHADAFEAALDERDDDDTELSRALRTFRNVAPALASETFRGKIDALRARLARVYIERLPAEEIVDFFDSPDTVFYTPPPLQEKPQSQESLSLAKRLRRAKGQALCVPANNQISRAR